MKLFEAQADKDKNILFRKSLKKILLRKKIKNGITLSTHYSTFNNDLI